MIKGNVTLEDISIEFTTDHEKLEVTYTVTDTFESDFGSSETKTVPQDKFFKALAIAVHSDGMPDYEADYPDAESIMGVIRWIP